MSLFVQPVVGASVGSTLMGDSPTPSIMFGAALLLLAIRLTARPVPGRGREAV